MKKSLRRPWRSASPPNRIAPITAPATYAPAASPIWPSVRPSVAGNVSTLASEPTRVTSSPSMIQLVPRAAINDAWKEDQRRRSRRAGTSVGNGPLSIAPIIGSRSAVWARATSETTSMEPFLQQNEARTDSGEALPSSSVQVHTYGFDAEPPGEAPSAQESAAINRCNRRYRMNSMDTQTWLVVAGIVV